MCLRTLDNRNRQRGNMRFGNGGTTVATPAETGWTSEGENVARVGQIWLRNAGARARRSCGSRGVAARHSDRDAAVDRVLFPE
jgi:hypothetical protein